MARSPRHLDMSPEQSIQRRLSEVESGVGRQIGNQMTGTKIVTYPGGSENTNTLTITHELGFIPHVQLTVVGGSSGFSSHIIVTEKTNSVIKVRANDSNKPGAGSTVEFDYLLTP